MYLRDKPAADLSLCSITAPEASTSPLFQPPPVALRRLFLATPLPADLGDEARATVDFLRSDAPRRDRAARTVAAILAMSEESLRFHFREPLDALGVGMITRKSLDIALDLALRGIRSSIKTVVNGFDDAQLLRVADLIEARLYPDPHW